MFKLVKIKSIFEVAPHVFDKDEYDVIALEISRRFVDKVIHNLGLFIKLYQINSTSESFVLPGNGSYHSFVYFTAIIFCPFVGEIIEGKVKSQSSSRIQITLRFFDDIYIYPSHLQKPSIFDSSKNCWVWLYSNENETFNFYVKDGDKLRFRVVDTVFTDTKPKKIKDNIDEKPLVIKASINEPGLGIISWWL